VKVRVPASSANLGPGFDALGLALELHAEIGLVDASTGSAERSKQVDEHHPASIAFVAAGGKGALWVRSPIPIGRGLGFSGAMRVGGAAAATVQRVGDQALSDHHADVLALAAGLEGHADNVAASLYGGVVVTDGRRAVGVETPLQPEVVLWIPEDTTSTSASRTALPAVVPFDDAVFNVGRTAMLVAALAAGDIDALAAATQDRLHQDRRFLTAPASRAALAAGLDAGAWCGWLSGSGPTVAFLAAQGAGNAVGEALPAGGHSRVVAIDRQGTVLVDD
jgi:homoserine kinase